MKKSIRFLALTLAFLTVFAAIPAFASQRAGNPFEDVAPSDYFYDAVIWAYDEGVTTGTTATKFAPASTCTRGQVVTFLWRAMGEPSSSSSSNPFEDVKTSDYYYKAVLWAIEQGITTGTSAKRFSPDVTCTNAHILTFIWRALGMPDETGEGEWYSDAVTWADNSGLTSGTYAGDFDPSGKCPRANVVTYLYRYYTSNVLTVYVSETGDDETADGTVFAPFATIDAAREFVSHVDKYAYTSIRIKIASGTYFLKDSIDLLPADSGSPVCTISYIGEKGTVITGGVSFTASDFTKPDEKALKKFPEQVRDSLVSIDLKQFGFSANPDDVRALSYMGGRMAPLSVNGNYATVARYPNTGYAYVRDGSAVNCEGGAAGAKNAEKQVSVTIFFDEEHMSHVKDWDDYSTIYIAARYSLPGISDNSEMISVIPELNSMRTVFTGEADPVPGMPFFWYNVPEELDVPGEYYIDSDAVLYYYPDDSFKNATFTMPLLELPLVTMVNTKYVSFSGITFESVRADGISGSGNNISIDGCEFRGISGNAVSLTGSSVTVSSNKISSVGKSGIRLNGGTSESLERSNNIISNNKISRWSETYGTDSYAIYVDGCGSDISHNTCSGSSGPAIGFDGPSQTIEYNECSSVCLFAGGKGAIVSDGLWGYGSVIRFNHVKNCGPASIPEGCHSISLANGQSGITVCGNVVENTNGNAIDVEGGRDNDIYGNLLIDCVYGIEYDSRYYDSVMENKGGNRVGPASWQFKSQAWTRTFPAITKLLFADESNIDEVITSAYFNAAPTSQITGNIVAMREGSMKENGAYNISKYVLGFSRILIPSDKNGTLLTFTDSYSVEDYLLKNSQTLSITLKQYKEIGSAN